MIDGDRTALIDLDQLTYGHREIDIANFEVHLNLRSLQGRASREHVTRWQQAFSSEYERRSSEPPNSILVLFYLATTYFRLACKYRLRSGGARIAASLLVRAESALNQWEREFPTARTNVSRIDSTADRGVLQREEAGYGLVGVLLR